LCGNRAPRYGTALLKSLGFPATPSQHQRRHDQSKPRLRRNLAPHPPELGVQRPLFRHAGRQDDTADPASMQRADFNRGMRRGGFPVK
jgi:hypothetical protein